jgi:hypothetical protein
MSVKLDELVIPTSIFDDEEDIADEFVRFWICNGNDHVTLRIGSLGPPEDEPVQWGHIAADIARHAVRGMLQDDPTRGTAEQLFAEIERGFRERLLKDLNFTGQLQGSKQ